MWISLANSGIEFSVQLGREDAKFYYGDGGSGYHRLTGGHEQDGTGNHS